MNEQPASRSRSSEARMSCLNSVPNGLAEWARVSRVW